jgi:prolipoprotein diacylglyceryltransferase
MSTALFGAAVGALALHIAESWSWISDQPITQWISGKSVLGGLLGGTAGTEIGKQMIGWSRSTGDAWVPALVVGLVIGRIGCQLSGTWDMTYGSPTGTDWGEPSGGRTGRQAVRVMRARHHAPMNFMFGGKEWP